VYPTEPEPRFPGLVPVLELASPQIPLTHRRSKWPSGAFAWATSAEWIDGGVQISYL